MYEVIYFYLLLYDLIKTLIKSAPLPHPYLWTYTQENWKSSPMASIKWYIYLLFFQCITEWMINKVRGKNIKTYLNLQQDSIKWHCYITWMGTTDTKLPCAWLPTPPQRQAHLGGGQLLPSDIPLCSSSACSGWSSLGHAGPLSAWPWHQEPLASVWNQ